MLGAQEVSVIEEFLAELKERMRATASDHVEAAHVEGFEAASEICLHVLKARNDRILANYSSTSPLSEGDQAVLAALNELKSEMERDLRRYWRPPVRPVQ